MSCILAIAKTTADAIPPALAAQLRTTPAICSIGSGAPYTDGDTEWLLYHGDGWTLEDVAKCTSLLTQAPLVLPSALDLSESENPWQAVADANGAPASLRLFQGVPDGWSAVSE